MSGTIRDAMFLSDDLCCENIKECFKRGIIDVSQKLRKEGGYKLVLIIGLSEIRTNITCGAKELCYCPFCGENLMTR